MSRFKRATDILILQPFDLATFQQGVPQQPAILMKYLSLPADKKGDIEHDIAAYEQQIEEERQQKRQKSNMNLSDEHLSAESHARKHEKEKHQCKGCGQWKTSDGFGGKDARQWRDRNNSDSCGYCKACKSVRAFQCKKCNVIKASDQYGGRQAQQWRQRVTSDKHGICKQCRDS